MTKAKQKAASEAALDDALEQTFPASDPISIGDDGDSGARIDRQPASLDHSLVERLSREVKDKAAPAAK